ncbi:MAG: acyl carrier protein [Gammaproteobacteria bacterium]|nr:acyl carrier protein [Gammaproteobacteria bacterium]
MSGAAGPARALLGKALGLSPAAIADDATVHDLEQWDSLGHMRLVAAIEAETGTILSAEQILALSSLPDVVRILTRSGK